MKLTRSHSGITRWQVFHGQLDEKGIHPGAGLRPNPSRANDRAGVTRHFHVTPLGMEWFLSGGGEPSAFPDAWDRYRCGDPPPVERHDLISAFHRRLTSDDEATRLAAAQAWSLWEGATSCLYMDQDFIASHENPHFALAFARIENHYFVNGGFFEVEDQLLRDAQRIANIPGVIVHGRYDVVCPLQNAWDLHKAWPKPV